MKLAVCHWAPTKQLYAGVELVPLMISKRAFSVACFAAAFWVVLLRYVGCSCLLSGFPLYCFQMAVFYYRFKALLDGVNYFF